MALAWCVYCHGVIPSEATTCQHCRKPLTAGSRVVKCQQCGKFILQSDHACKYCDTVIYSPGSGKKCSWCSSELPVGATACSVCGVQVLEVLPPKTSFGLKCPKCGHTCQLDRVGRCPDCGYSFYGLVPNKEVPTKTAEDSYRNRTLSVVNSGNHSSVHCPHCGYDDFDMVRKGFSFGKAIVGTVVLGPVGAVAGLGSNKYQRVCKRRKKTF